MPSRSQLRLASRIKFLVSTVIQQDLHDPRLGFVTVLSVELTEDFREAKVLVSVLGAQGVKSKTVHALEDAKGYIQRKIGDQLHLRQTPLLRFEIDEEQDKIGRLERLIEETKNEDRAELPIATAAEAEGAEETGGDDEEPSDDDESAEETLDADSGKDPSSEG
ncbi:MAG: 30S ribosome-binding factor RbfA [Planctomycetota bacterium]